MRALYWTYYTLVVIPAILVRAWYPPSDSTLHKVRAWAPRLPARTVDSGVVNLIDPSQYTVQANPNEFEICQAQCLASSADLTGGICTAKFSRLQSQICKSWCIKEVEVDGQPLIAEGDQLRQVLFEPYYACAYDCWDEKSRNRIIMPFFTGFFITRFLTYDDMVYIPPRRILQACHDRCKLRLPKILVRREVPAALRLKHLEFLEQSNPGLRKSPHIPVALRFQRGAGPLVDRAAHAVQGWARRLEQLEQRQLRQPATGRWPRWMGPVEGQAPAWRMPVPVRVPIE
ncbi:MAG: hypothetical protein M1826_004631 [Phylliscum demangeonii]|nr:MAG: hypothetical protein M1826_004631 [Phylliscum demangeonii]